MRRKNKKMKIIAFLFSILLIGIGYAYLTANLRITGTTKIGNAKFDVHFENPRFNYAASNVTFLSNSNSNVDPGTPIIKGEGANELEWNATFSEPGDYYDASADIVNEGDMDAEIDLKNSTIKIKIGNDEEIVSTFEDAQRTVGNNLVFSLESGALYTDITLSNGDVDTAINNKYLNALSQAQMEVYCSIDENTITNEEWENLRGKNITITANIKYIQGVNNPHDVETPFFYFTNPVVTSSNPSNSEAPRIVNAALSYYSNRHKINFEYEFNDPSDYYEVEMDMVNENEYRINAEFQNIKLTVGDGEPINLTYNKDNLPEGLVISEEPFDSFASFCEDTTTKGKIRINLDPNISEEAFNALKNKKIKVEYDIGSYLPMGSTEPNKCSWD